MGKIGSSDIASLLRREISKGTYRENERLPSSRDLAAHYNVARNTLRDALRRLEEEGIVNTRAGSGTFVTLVEQKPQADAIERANPLELIDARFALEPHICRLCVLHGTREDFATLEVLCNRMEAAVGDPVAFAEADTEFHKTLAKTTRNSLLIWVIEQINSVRSQEEWTRMRQLTLNEAMISQYNAEHRQILNAIRSREPERAANVMKSHLEAARISLMRAADA